MRFQELRQIADFRDEMRVLSGRFQEIQARSVSLASRRLGGVIELIFEDFSRFFTERGFEIEAGENEIMASYKTVGVQLKLQDPGRRKEDLASLLKFQMVLTAIDKEIYTVFVQCAPDRGQVPPPARTPPKHDSDAVSEVTTALRQTDAQLERLAGAMTAAAEEFTNRQNRSVAEDLVNTAGELRRTLAEESNKWQKMNRGEYVMLVSREREEWVADSAVRYDSIYALLDSMDQIG